MASDNGCNAAMYNLAVHYSTTRNYVLATKYYLMAINNGFEISILNLPQGESDADDKWDS
mgnify:CR=1 FL=1